MRRVGVIVALGALLGLFGGVVTASPALADGRGGGWQVVPVPPTVTVDPVFCGFEIQATLLVGKEFVKALKTADGSMALLVTGTLKASLTNPANGKTITANLSGPAKEIFFPDGSATFPETEKTPGPDDFSVPIEANQAAPRSRMCGTQESVSTLLITVGER